MQVKWVNELGRYVSEAFELVVEMAMRLREIYGVNDMGFLFICFAIIISIFGVLSIYGAYTLISQIYYRRSVSMKRHLATIFISYAWTSQQHIIWVKELADKLREEGINVIYDQTHLRSGQDKYAFMEKMVNDKSIDKVLLICNTTYKDKADKRVGGVGTETQIITPDIYESVEQRKFIPIVIEKDDAGNAYLPIFCRSRIYVDMSEYPLINDGYIDLVNEILERNKVTYYSNTIEISELKFFAGRKENCPNLKNRVYRSSFKKATLIYIYFELRLEHRIKDVSADTIVYSICDSDGIVIFQGENNVQLRHGDNIAWVGYGYEEAGHWSLGRYSVIIGFKNSGYIERFFHIIE